MRFNAGREGLEAAQQPDEWLRSGFNFVFSTLLQRAGIAWPPATMSALPDLVCPRNLSPGAKLSQPWLCDTPVMTNPASPTPLCFRTSDIKKAASERPKRRDFSSGKSAQMGTEQQQQQNNKITGLGNRERIVPSDPIVCCK